MTVTTLRTNRPAMRLYHSIGGLEPSSETVMFSFRLGERDGATGVGNGRDGWLRSALTSGRGGER